MISDRYGMTGAGVHLGCLMTEMKKAVCLRYQYFLWDFGLAEIDPFLSSASR